ncbi:DUF1819 family protein [Myxosarcina sp. GI1]|uniref:DUF1819 family protein n=1 Tax=Myxosarcina sp. GI1 TaxID=1541065 RepID=UPI00056AF676|nr:DUF1819 family protein [Myxosarcina sp. GI1]
MIKVKTTPTKKYAFSFVIGGLLYQESVRFAALFVELGNWKRARELAVEQNLLQTRTAKTSERLCREICSRLKTLNEKELKLLVDGTVRDRGYILWLAVCRRYKFIRDFAVEILREKFLNLETELDRKDFEVFFARKAEWHDELEALKPMTKAKGRRTLFKMLREADLLSPENRIYPAMPSASLINAVFQERHKEALFFPLLKSQLEVGNC